MLRSGIAPISSPMNSRTPCGASTSTRPRTFSRPPCAHMATAASRSRASIAAKYRRATASALLPEMRLRVPASCCMFAATSWTLALVSLSPSDMPASFVPLNAISLVSGGCPM